MSSDVTVVVTCYNHQSYIEQCLASIRTQTVQPDAVIVLNDASSDDSSFVIGKWLNSYSPNWTFLQNSRNIGLNRTLNIGLSKVESPYFIHISGDDWMEPRRIEHHLHLAHSSDAETAIFAASVREVDEGGRLLVTHDYSDRFLNLTGAKQRARAHAALLERNLIAAPAAMVLTAAVQSVGGYDEALSFEDYDMWLRLTRRFGIEFEQQVVTNYRTVGASFSRSDKHAIAFIDSEARALAKHLGVTPENDLIIQRRIYELAAKLQPLDTKQARRLRQLAGLPEATSLRNSE